MKRAHLARFLLLDELQGVEVLDFGCDLAGKLGGIEAGDALHSALAGEQSLPDFFCVMTDPADQPDSRNDDTTSQAIFLSRGR